MIFQTMRRKELMLRIISGAVNLKFMEGQERCIFLMVI
jgi:hypothetical protein